MTEISIWVDRVQAGVYLFNSVLVILGSLFLITVLNFADWWALFTGGLE